MSSLMSVFCAGIGIAPEDFDNIAKQHNTSKLTSFEDLDRLNSFGFRYLLLLKSLCDEGRGVEFLVQSVKFFDCSYSFNWLRIREFADI